MNEKLDKKVVTRFPPSPTGFLHIGRARTALFNYLFAKHNNGSFIFRFENTDRERSKTEYELDIVESLAWLGISYDNKEVWRQAERSDIYRSYLKKLLDSGVAYVSKETEGDRAEVIRFKNPNKTIEFNDLVRGKISFDTTDLGDFVIAKSLEEPLYHLAVVIDDMEMSVTHILRGEDGISNTPRQILLQEALGFPRPEYAHIPLILAPDRSKLSGRHGAVSVREYREKGYFPEATINYLALLGWNPGDDREIFSLDELVKVFDLSKVQKGGAIFNIEKLNWFNKQYLQKLSPEEKLSRARELPVPVDAKYDSSMGAKRFETLKINPQMVNLMTERVSTLAEFRDLIFGDEFGYFFGAPLFDKKLLLWKEETDFAKTKNRLMTVLDLLRTVPAESFTKENIKTSVWPFAEKEGKGEVLWPMRVALSGKEKSPDPFTLAELLGPDESLKRITIAINLLS